MLNRDLLTNVNPTEAARGTMIIIDAIQDLPAGVQQAAITAAFLGISKHNKMRPVDAFEIINNVVNHVDGKRPEFKAVDMYIEKELN